MGTQTKRLQYRYDVRGNRSALIDHDGGRFTYSYDSLNRITQVQNPQGDRTSFSYDNAGRRTLKKLANGTRASFAYDPAGNLAKLYNLKSDGTVISSFDYQYDKVGNRTAVREADGSRVTWSYDATYQLTGEHRTGSNAYRDTYTYDPTGNRLVKIHDGARTTSAYDAANQLRYTEDAAGRTTYTFDADGNQQRILAPNGDRTTYVWDYENRMTRVELPSGIRNTMAYEPEGLRVKLEASTGVKKFVWDEQNYLAETDGSNDTQVVYTNEPRRYGNLVSQRRLSGGVWTPHWYHFDAIGSTRELTTAAQVVSDTRLYYAWGNAVVSSGSTVSPLRWVGDVGYYVDIDIGSCYVRARVYEAAIARWVSLDPIGFDAGDVNLYRYVANAPVYLLDPSGLIICPPPDPNAPAPCIPEPPTCKTKFVAVGPKALPPLLGLLGAMRRRFVCPGAPVGIEIVIESDGRQYQRCIFCVGDCGKNCPDLLYPDQDVPDISLYRCVLTRRFNLKGKNHISTVQYTCVCQDAPGNEPLGPPWIFPPEEKDWYPPVDEE